METLCHFLVMRWYERAKKIMDERGILAAEIQRRMEESQSNVSRWLNGSRGADSIAAAAKFSAALNIPFMELVFGQSEPTSSPQLTIDVSSKLRSFHDAHPISREHYHAVRILKGRVAAGSPLDVDESETDGWALIFAEKSWMPNTPENYSCVHVSGRSMWPILSDGDIVAIDHAQRDPRELDGKMVAFRVDGGVTIKWLKYDASRKVLVGIPENTEELDHIVTLEGPEIDAGIVGKVAWWWAKR